MSSVCERTTKDAQLMLPYFKQGDDLREVLRTATSVPEALEMHAEVMDEAAKQLRDVAKAVAGYDVTVDADAHYISITGPAELIDGLIAGGQLEETLDDEEDDEDASESE